MDAHKSLSLEGFLAIPEEERGERSEFIDGKILPHKGNGGLYGRTLAAAIIELGATVPRSLGWTILPGVSVIHQQSREARVHDIAGWKQRLSKEAMDASVVPVRPDWVCQVVVPTPYRDIEALKRTLEIEEVPFYWVLDAASERLIVLERIDGQLVQTRNLSCEDGAQRIPPFETVDLAISNLLGDDPED